MVTKQMLATDGTTGEWLTTIKLGETYILHGGAPADNSVTVTVYDKTADQLRRQVEVPAEDVARRILTLLNESIHEVVAVENPTPWSSRFAPRPSLIPESTTEQWLSRTNDLGEEYDEWIRLTQYLATISPNGQYHILRSGQIAMAEKERAFHIGMTGSGDQAILHLFKEIEEGRPIVILEEPETHLHPALVKHVGTRLHEIVQNEDRQIFLSTHSPFLVQYSDLTSFYAVRKQGYETHASPLVTDEDRKTLFYSLGIKPSDVLFADAVLLVEGHSDELFMNLISHKIGIPLAHPYVHTVRIDGKDNAKYHLSVWGPLAKRAGLPLYMILDNNASAEITKAIDDGHVERSNHLTLSKGDLEDYYPRPLLREAVRALFDKDIEEEIPVGKTVQCLRSRLQRDWPKNTWKAPLARAVAERMSANEIEEELSEMVAFLRRMYNRLISE